MPYTDTSTSKTDPVRFKHSHTAGEVPSLVDGEIAINHADGKLFVGGRGGSTNSLQATLSPAATMEFPAAWPVAQASINATIADSSSDTLQFKTMPLPAGGPATGRYYEACRLLDGKILVFWYDNNSPTAAVHPILWDVEADTAEYLTGNTLNTNKAFSPTVLPNGSILLPSYGLYSTKVLTIKDGSLQVVALTDGGHSDWTYNGTYFAGSRYQVGLSPDGGLGKARIFDSRNNTLKDVSSFTQPGGIRSGTMLPDGRSMLFRGAQGGGVYKACFYNPDSQTITYGSTLPQWYECGSLMPDGKVLMAPYQNYSGTNIITPVVYDPVADSSTAATAFDVGAAANFYACYGSALLPTGNYLYFPGNNSAGTRYLYSPTTGLVGTYADAASFRGKIIPIWANGGWLVTMGGSHANDLRPSAMKAWTGEFDANLLNSSLFSKWV